MENTGLIQYWLTVKRLTQMIALLTLLLTCATPVMACMIPDAQMSAQERACCRMMNSQCGQTGMSGMPDCCGKGPANLQAAALRPSASFYNVRTVFLTSSVLDALLTPGFTSLGWITLPDRSPPLRSKPTNSPLRI